DVLRPCHFEVVQHVLRAVSRPDGQKAVIVVLEAAAATHGYEARISDPGEDHSPSPCDGPSMPSRDTCPISTLPPPVFSFRCFEYQWRKLAFVSVQPYRQIAGRSHSN